MGNTALEWTLALSGLADVHASAATAAQLVAIGRLAPDDVQVGVLAAFAANTAVKVGMAFASGGRGYGLRVLPGTVAMVAAFAAALWWR